jgi:hypothetical protein
VRNHLTLEQTQGSIFVQLRRVCAKTEYRIGEVATRGSIEQTLEEVKKRQKLSSRTEVVLGDLEFNLQSQSSSEMLSSALH